MTSAREPLAIIWDTDPGSYQLLIYQEGVLGLHVPFWNRAGFALRYVHGGAPSRLDPSYQDVTREERRIRHLTSANGPEQLAADEPGAFFIAEATIIRVALRYRVVFSALDLELAPPAAAKVFRWTPSINPPRPIRDALSTAFGPRYAR